MENRVAAFAGKHAVKLVEIFHRSVDSLDKLPMAAMTEFINRMRRLGFKREGVSFAKIDKPAMEGPATLGGRVIVPLLVKRTWRLDVSGPRDAHQLLAGRRWILRMFQHVGRIDVVKRLVFKREGFNVRQQKRKPQLLDWLPTLGIILREEVDEVRRILMWS